jgi:hypothetical protein
MKVIKRTLAAVALGTVLAGCGAVGGTSSPSPGRVVGHVTVRVCGGANREYQAGCQAYPSPGVTLAFTDALGAHGSQATSDRSGGYAVNLPAGRYEVTIEPGDSAGPRLDHGPPQFVTVTAGKTLTADFAYTVQLL